MKIELIVPVIVDYLFQDFLESVEANSILPQRILLIDNTPQGIRPKSSKVEIVRLKSKSGNVNESWNVGIKHVSKGCEAVGIYNDDIVLNPNFFTRIIETLNWDSRCGVACPETVPVTRSLRKGPSKKIIMQRSKERETQNNICGWCFTIKKPVLDLVPLIPDTVLKTFAGDLWFWEYTHKLGYFWAKDLGNFIRHYVGVSVLATGKRAHKSPDWHSWQTLRAKIR
jgi:hypothetical protein